MSRRATPLALGLLAQLLLVPAPCTAQHGWALLQWTDDEGDWQTLEYDRASIRRLASTLTVELRRDRLTAIRQDSVIVEGEHPWTRQAVELDCLDEIWRVVRWEARDETGVLLSAGGGEGWRPIRSGGYPRALERQFCPWP